MIDAGTHRSAIRLPSIDKIGAFEQKKETNGYQFARVAGIWQFLEKRFALRRGKPRDIHTV